jgi:hypothetical protein
MAYKKKLITLLSLIAALALTYTASIVFAPEAAGSRSASHVWLDSRLAARAVRIVIDSAGESVELYKKNSQWFVSSNGKEYPARQLRVEDFMGIFTKPALWPVRSSSASSHERLGLTEETASRITIYGENTALLDLLLGSEDSTGREINVRSYAKNEVRSGDNKISSYITGSANSWFNFRLIPESEDGRVAVDSVQRLSVYSDGGTQIFSRKNRSWTVSGLDIANPDQSGIDAYVRAVLNIEGDDFDDSVPGDDPALDHSRIVLELGNGSIKTIRFSGPDESGRRLAHVSGADYVYSLAPWAAAQLFRSASDFERR